MRKHYDFSNAKKNPYAARLKRQGGARLPGAKPSKKAPPTKAARDLDKEITAIMRMKDEDIDFSDIPEITDWSNAVRGKFYRPIKKSLTIRVDADVLAWLKAQGKGYQTRINSLLRAAMENRARR